jgi:hypothetical protein
LFKNFDVREKLLKQKKLVLILVFFAYIYFFIVGIPILYLLKRRFKVKKIILGHYHIPLKIKDFIILEAYLFNNKVYKFKEFFVITDVHLGYAKYSKKELIKLEKLIENNKLIITGDFFEKKVKRKLYKKEIEILNKILKNKNIIYIKGNHDPKIEGQLLYYKYKDYLFIHGHVTFFPRHFFDLVKVLTQKQKV